MFAWHLQQFSTDTVDPNANHAGGAVPPWFDMNIRSSEAVRFGDYAIYQLNNRRTGSQTLIF